MTHWKNPSFSSAQRFTSGAAGECPTCRPNASQPARHHLNAVVGERSQLGDINSVPARDHGLGKNNSCFLRKVILEGNINEALDVRWALHVFLCLEKDGYILSSKLRK